MFVRLFKMINGRIVDQHEFISDSLIKGMQEPVAGTALIRFGASYEDYYISEQDFRKLIDGSGVQHVERVERIFGNPPQGGIQFNPFNPFDPFGGMVNQSVVSEQPVTRSDDVIDVTDHKDY